MSKCRGDGQTGDVLLQNEVLCGIFDLLTSISNQMSEKGQKACFCPYDCPD